MPHAVDVHVGQKIRQRRWLIGMTQQALADHVGIKFQQIQKYETGANRVSASRLWEIAETLAVPIDYFFEGLESGGGAEQVSLNGVDVGSSSVPHSFINSKEVASLVQTYFQLSETQRKSLVDLAKVLNAGS